MDKDDFDLWMEQHVKKVTRLSEEPNKVGIGIYFLCENTEVDYVGQAKEYANRIIQPDHKVKKISRYYFLSIKPELYDQIDEVEQHYIDKFQPYWNTKHRDFTKKGLRFNKSDTHIIIDLPPKQESSNLKAIKVLEEQLDRYNNKINDIFERMLKLLNDQGRPADALRLIQYWEKTEEMVSKIANDIIKATR